MFVTDRTYALIGQFYGIILPCMHAGRLWACKNQSKQLYNQQLVNLERSIFTGTSQTSALPYCQYGNILVYDFPVKTSLVNTECQLSLSRFILSGALTVCDVNTHKGKSSLRPREHKIKPKHNLQRVALTLVLLCLS